MVSQKRADVAGDAGGVRGLMGLGGVKSDYE